MPATTLAELVTLAGSYKERVLLRNIFAETDPLAGLMPFVPKPAGTDYIQPYENPAPTATSMAIRTAMTAQAMTSGKYTAHMHHHYRMDDDPLLADDTNPGQQGVDARLQKKINILTSVSNKYRSDLQIGSECTLVIGANLQALFGVDYAIEVGCAGNIHSFTDMNTVAPLTLNIGFQWVTAADTIAVKIAPDTAYGPAVTLSATNRFKVPLYSGGTTGAANYSRWVRATFTWVTINGAGNYDSDTGGLAADYAVSTPSLAPMGFLYKVNPKRIAFDNLVFDASGFGTNPTAAGAAADQDNLTWLALQLQEASGGDLSRCIMLADTPLWLALSSVITGLGQKSESYRFMGRELLDLNFGGIRVQRSPYLPTTLSPNGAATTRNLLGLVLGENKCHCKYSSIATDRTLAGLVASLSGSNSAADPAGNHQLPIMYYETLYSPTSLVANQFGVMSFNPECGSLDACAMVANLTA